MRYWALSTFATDPRLHHTVTWELMCAYRTRGISPGSLAACNELAALEPTSDTPLLVVHSVDAPMRRVYAHRPCVDDWLKLERGGFVAANDTFGFVVDALH